MSAGAKSAKNFFVEGRVDGFVGSRRIRAGANGNVGGLQLEVLMLREGKPHRAALIRGRALDDGALELVVEVDGAPPAVVRGSRGSSRQRFWRAKRPNPTGLAWGDA